MKKISEEEKNKIQEEAKAIIESFSKKLSEIKNLSEESFIERAMSTRTETKTEKGNFNLKKRILENAENKNEDFIIAEKKGW